MNKNHIFTANMEQTERQIDRFYEGAAFGAIHFDGIGQRQGIEAALTVLETAQGLAMEANMQTEEVRSACAYLGDRNDKVKPLARTFWRALVIPDQVIRFEATAQALRVIRQQFNRA